MTAVNTIADEAIRDVPPNKRNCYFQDEYQLEMYQLYSQSGCIFECKMRIGQAKTFGGCTPWFYPTRGEMRTRENNYYFTKLDSNMCDPWQTQVFLSAVMDGGSGKQMANILSSPGPKPLAPNPLVPNQKPRGLGLTLKCCRPPTSPQLLGMKEESQNKTQSVRTS